MPVSVGDGDVDLDDYAVFMREFTGPLPSPTDCSRSVGGNRMGRITGNSRGWGRRLCRAEPTNDLAVSDLLTAVLPVITRLKAF